MTLYQSTGELEDNFKMANIHIIQDPKRGGMGRKKIFEEIIADIFLNLTTINTDAQSSVNPKHKNTWRKLPQVIACSNRPTLIKNLTSSKREKDALRPRYGDGESHLSLETKPPE